MGESRGSIGFFTTYRPSLPLDIFSSPINPPPTSDSDEFFLTDGVNYNQNGRAIPATALKELLQCLAIKNPKLASKCGATPDDAISGRVTGLVFVSEREDGLETLQVALRFKSADGGDAAAGNVVVMSLTDIYGTENFSDARMEDSGCIAGGFSAGGRTVGHSLVYVSTKEQPKVRRAPWTVVYKTNLADGKTERLTPPGQYDVSPAVSPSGEMVAVANFQFNQWTGEIDRLNTDIVIMNVDREAQGGLRRKILIKDGGWPTWGSDRVIFFHRGINKDGGQTQWGVFRYDMATKQITPVTPGDMDAVTPAAISETKVAVAIMRKKSGATNDHRDVLQCRHIEIFDVNDGPNKSVKITKIISAEVDHYNPFILDGGKRVGYHRVRTTDELAQTGGSDVSKRFERIQSPESEKDVGLFRVSGVFPTVSKDGSKLAFVDNNFKTIYVVDSKGMHKVHENKTTNSIFSIVWNQNPDKDTLYACVGPAFTFDKPLEIYAITNVSGQHSKIKMIQLTEGNFNNAFPSSNPDGTRFVFRSTCNRDGGDIKCKNLWIIEDTEVGEYDDGEVTRLTNGPWTDTHCSWSPRGDWIVFSSSRDKPADAQERARLDPGYFAIYLVNPNDPTVVVRVMTSSDTIAGHVTHPVFSPDMRSIVIASDIAAVSSEPISMPQFLHSVRPYGDIFVVDLRDINDIKKNKDIQEYNRLTHSRYEYSTPTWSKFATDDPNTQWSKLVTPRTVIFGAACPR